MNDPPHSTFPPILAARRITSPAHPFDAAVEGAGRGELRAADALWSDAGGRAELAIVLEPEVAVEISREIAAVMFLAVADSLGALLPPQSSVFLRWPNTILLNLGDVGRIALEIERTPDERPPDWLVIGVSVQFGTLTERREPGELVDRTAIADEGGAEIAPLTFLHSVAAHFLVRLDQWQQRGLASFERYLAERIEGFDAPVLIGRERDGFVGQVKGVEAGMVLRVQPVVGEEHRLQPDVSRAGPARATAGPA